MDATTKAIPVVGHVFELDFGTYDYILEFDTENSLTFTVLRAPNPFEVDTRLTVDYTRVEVRPNAYWVYWQVPGQDTVTHFEDFERNVVYSNITLADGEFLNLSGTIKRLR